MPMPVWSAGPLRAKHDDNLSNKPVAPGFTDEFLRRAPHSISGRAFEDFARVLPTRLKTSVPTT